MKNPIIAALVALCLLFSSKTMAFTEGHYLADASRAFSRWEPDPDRNRQDAVMAMFFMAYVSSAMDMMRAMSMTCIYGGSTTQGQIAAVVAKYIKDNPEMWSKEAIVIVSQALRPVFPCKD